MPRFQFSLARLLAAMGFFALALSAAYSSWWFAAPWFVGIAVGALIGGADGALAGFLAVIALQTGAFLLAVVLGSFHR